MVIAGYVTFVAGRVKVSIVTKVGLSIHSVMAEKSMLEAAHNPAITMTTQKTRSIARSATKIY